MRFQGGTLFPLVVALVLVGGLALITYARASRPGADVSAPQPNVDHWHWAYAFQLCSDEATIIFAGDKEIRDASGFIVGDEEFVRTGVHSHDDGVIHWHPYTVVASGNRAKVGIFFDNYGAELTDDKLEFTQNNLVYEESEFPVPDDFPMVYEEGVTECDGEEGTLKAVKWTSYNDRNSEQQYVADFDNIRIDGDGQVIVVAFVPNDVDVAYPSWAARLPELGAADSGEVPTSLPPADESVTVESTEPLG